jgi:hypothetical protein
VFVVVVIVKFNHGFLFACILVLGQPMEQTLAIWADIVLEKRKFGEDFGSGSKMTPVVFEHMCADREHCAAEVAGEMFFGLIVAEMVIVGW